MGQKIKTALVVDDSRLARIALSKQLQKHAIEVETAGTGTEAMERLQTSSPDVVFMDFMMPDMDGFEATRRILDSPSCAHPPVVMYTSQDTDEDRARAREIGISGFLSKPSSEDALADIIAQLERGVAAAPRPVAAAPAPAPVAETVVPVKPEPRPQMGHEEIRIVAKEAAQAAAVEAAENVARERMGAMHVELDKGVRDAIQQARDSAAEAAREVAAEIARETAAETAARVAEERAQQTATTVAEEASNRLARQAAAQAVRDLSDELQETIEQRLGEVTHSSDFKTQIKGVVFEHGLPAVQQAVLPAAQQGAEDAVKHAVQPLQEQIEALQARLEQQAQQLAEKPKGASPGVAGVVGLIAGAIAGALVALFM